EPKRSQTASLAKTSDSGPQIAYERFRRQIQIQVDEKREAQIRGLNRLLDLGPDEREVPGLKFRLAELYYEKSRFYFFRAQEAGTEAERRNSQRASKEWLQRALDLYRDIRARYPKYERGPEVLFALGQSYWSQGRFDEATKAYADLIRNFADSPLVPEAWIAFGEYYFNRNSVYKALKSYQNAATDKRSRVYGFALYKQAWCYYNLAEWEKALRLFRGTVLYSQLSDQLSGENKIALGREAQKDWVRTYSHIGSAKQARFKIADLLGVDDCKGQACRDLLETLADLWADEGYFDESAHLYRSLIALAPQELRNAYFQGRVVDLVSRGGNKARVVAETRKLVKIYGETRRALTERPPTDDPTDTTVQDVEEAAVTAETTMRRLAQLWNREGRKTRNDKTYGFAEAMYIDYLKLFSDAKYAYEMRFQLADLFYKLEKYDRAADAYKATVLAEPQGKHVADAANDNILAVEEHIKDLRLRRPKLKGADPVALHPQQQRLVDACDRYAKYVSTKAPDRLVAIQYKAGKVMYDYNQHAEALRRLDEIVQNHPRSPQAEFAANLVVDIHNLREDWQGLYDAASKYLKSRVLLQGRDKLSTELAQFSDYAKFKLVQALEQKAKANDGDMTKVGEAYEAFTSEFPKSKNADKALFNASVAYDSAGRAERADRQRRRLLQRYPDSPLVAEVALYVAKQAAARADYKVAAQAYLKFVDGFGQDPRARDALYNAAVFYAGVGKVRTANKLRLRYLEEFGRARGAQKEAAEVYWSIARDLERSGRWRSAADRYRDYAKEFPATDRFWEALWREADLRQRKLRQRKAADKIRSRLLGIYINLKKKKRPLSESARRFASKVAFYRVKKIYDEYRKQRLKTPSLRNTKPFRRSLVQKARGRQRVIQSYTRVVREFQHAESTVASLYQIARTWDVFVDAIVGVPCPRGLKRDTCQQLKAYLDEEATPARESALQAYQTCVDTSTELNTFTDYSTRCVKALEKRAPDRFPKLIEKRAPYRSPPRIDRLEPRPLILRGRPSPEATARASMEVPR
ncbi:MAG: tetratricopeptide repeat protein, partial [Myxococcota bacterium]